ncbi:S-layer homology domain-containing protein [Moorella naiadis]|uniref:S-layer homology domain-containing protein n=1 Tax=Moorella naiadis (nom. illeg.) TaxID=3093670 RepID=UPI003D9CAD14
MSTRQAFHPGGRPAALATAVCLIIGLLMLLVVPAWGEAAVSPLMDKAVQFLQHDYLKNGLLNSEMGVGSYAFYVLRQAGVDAGAWTHQGVTLREAVVKAVRNDLDKGGEIRAKQLAQDLAAMQALGEKDLAGRLLQALKNRQTDRGFEDIGPLSIYNNMPAFDFLSRAGMLEQINIRLARNYILERQYVKEQNARYGSWGSQDGDQYYADFMATAEAVRTLHYLDPQKKDLQVQQAIQNGLAWMQKQQKPDGSFMAGMDDPVIDTAEVMVTLKTLGMDPTAWKSGPGKSAVDYLRDKSLNADGSFGTSGNTMDAIWVLWACLALEGKAGQPAQLQPGPQEGPTRQTQPAGKTTFKDLQGHWAEGAVKRLLQMGVVSGYPDGTFKPEGQVTRYEIASLMVRLLKPAGASGQDLFILDQKFKDSRDIPQWAREAVAVALREGLIAGYPQEDGALVFKGEDPVSRAELAAVMARIIKKKGGEVRPKELDFTDAGQIPAWAQEAVGVAYAQGVAGGYPDRTFRAERKVTRAEAAAMLLRLAEVL